MQETQPSVMEGVPQYSSGHQHAVQDSSNIGMRPTQLSFIDPIETHKYISTSDGTVLSQYPSQYEQPMMVTGNSSQISGVQPSVLSSRMSQPPSSFAQIQSFQQPIQSQNPSMASRGMQDPSRMIQQSMMSQNPSRMTQRSTMSQNPPRMAQQSMMSQNPSRMTQPSVMSQDPSMLPNTSRMVSTSSRVAQNASGIGSAISRNGSRISQYCGSNGHGCMSGIPQSQQVVSYPVPPYALDQPCACNNPIPFSSTQNSNQNHISLKCTCGLEQQNLSQIRPPPISPSMMPCLSTMSGRPYMDPSNIREQPTRDNDMVCPCSRNTGQSFKVSPFGGCTGMNITDTTEAICLPCGRSFPDTLKDTCWRVKIMKDVGVLTRGLDHAIQTQTSETRMVNSDKLESLLPPTERFMESLEDGDGGCAACKAAAENQAIGIGSETASSRRKLTRCRSTITGKAIDCGTRCECEEDCEDICLRSGMRSRSRSPGATASTYSFRPTPSHHRKQNKGCCIL